MSRVSIFVFGFVALVILCLLCVRCHSPGIQLDVQSRSEAALAATSLKTAVVSLEGRDATLTGTVPTESARASAEAAVGGVRGVRRVSNDLAVLPSARSSAAGASDSGKSDTGASDSAAPILRERRPGKLGFSSRRGNLTLRGRMPTAERLDELVAQARSLWGEDRVVSKLRVNEAMDTTCWPESFEGFLTTLKTQAQDVQVSLTGCRMELGGSALSDLSRQRLGGALATALSSFKVKDSMTVRQPQTAAEEVQADLDAFLAAKIVEFGTNRAELTASGRKILDRVGEILRGSDSPLEISGHTDSRGDEAYNLDLSQRRADAVRRYLVVEGGVEESRLTATGYGETRPVADNETPEGRQKNRRIEFRAQ